MEAVFASAQAALERAASAAKDEISTVRKERDGLSQALLEERDSAREASGRCRRGHRSRPDEANALLDASRR